MGKNKYYCKIDGAIHNLSDVQEVLDGKSNRNIVLIMYEDHGMDIVSANTFESVLKFNNNEIPADYDEALKRMQEHNQASIPKSPPKPRCPRCESTDIRRRQGLVNSKIGLYEQYYICYSCMNTFRNPK